MISLRRARTDDSEAVFEWRNDEVTRAASVSQDHVSFEDHERWLAGVLADSSRYLYIVRDEDERVGLCRFDADITARAAEVSINLNPAFRGKGYAARILGAAIEQFRADCGAGIRLTATIRPHNVASLRIFAAMGFTPVFSEHGLDHFELDV